MITESEIKLTYATSEQIRLMKHAIRFEPKKVKRGKYVAWRNYFFQYAPDPEWEKLVNNGLAIKSQKGNGVYYCVSSKGIQFLSDILGAKIIEDD